MSNPPTRIKTDANLQLQNSNLYQERITLTKNETETTQ